MATESTKIRDYEAEDASKIVRLFYETVRTVNRGDYSEEQVEAWAPGMPDPEEWHARMADAVIARAARRAADKSRADLDEPNKW